MKNLANILLALWVVGLTYVVVDTWEKVDYLYDAFLSAESLN